MKILYLHGWQSQVGGTKPTWLENNGIEVIQPALPADDFDAAVEIAQAALQTNAIDGVVGSSRGGAVAMNIETGNIPLILLCPAWKNWGAAKTVKPGTRILHATDDEVIPYSDSLDLLNNSGLDVNAHLITTGADHRLSDSESLERLLACVLNLTI